jgi:hypothetical protein
MSTLYCWYFWPVVNMDGVFIADDDGTADGAFLHVDRNLMWRKTVRAIGRCLGYGAAVVTIGSG